MPITAFRTVLSTVVTGLTLGFAAAATAAPEFVLKLHHFLGAKAPAQTPKPAMKNPSPAPVSSSRVP